jgi:hypothetical protein
VRWWFLSIFGEGNRPLIVSIQHRGLEFALFSRIDEPLLDFSKLAKPNSFSVVDCRLLAQLTAPLGIIFSTMRMTKIRQSQIYKNQNN